MGVKADREARNRALRAAAGDIVRFVQATNGKIWWHRRQPGNNHNVARSVEGFHNVHNAHRAAERACPDLVPIPKPSKDQIIVDVPTEVV